MKVCIICTMLILVCYRYRLIFKDEISESYWKWKYSSWLALSLWLCEKLMEAQFLRHSHCFLLLRVALGPPRFTPMTIQTTCFMSERVWSRSPVAVCCLLPHANISDLSLWIFFKDLCVNKTQNPIFCCPAQLKKKRCRLQSVAGWKSAFLKATEPCLPQCDMFPQQQDWVTKSAFFFIFSWF